jgi:hypothetical protein
MRFSNLHVDIRRVNCARWEQPKKRKGAIEMHMSLHPVPCFTGNNAIPLISVGDGSLQCALVFLELASPDQPIDHEQNEQKGATFLDVVL